MSSIASIQRNDVLAQMCFLQKKLQFLDLSPTKVLSVPHRLVSHSSASSDTTDLYVFFCCCCFFLQCWYSFQGIMSIFCVSHSKVELACVEMLTFSMHRQMHKHGFKYIPVVNVSFNSEHQQTLFHFSSL